MAKYDLTDDFLIEQLRHIRDNGGNVTKTAEALGMSRVTLQDQKRKAEGRGLTPDTNLKRTQEEEIKSLKRKIRTMEKDDDTAEAVRQKLYDIASISPAPPKWVTDTSKVSKSSGVPMVFWSDWHYGEVVNKEEVGGVNEFNKEIADKRIELLVNRTIDLCMNHMTNPKYPGIVVALGGDMISGDIHEELQDTNWGYTLEIVNELVDKLASALETMADTFGNVFVPCVVGNHGRSTRKPRMKGRVQTSFEWNIYVQLAKHFKKDKRIHFLIPNEADARFNILGHRFLLTHGDSLGVRGGDGIIGAIGPIMRGSIKVGRLESQIGRDFDTIMMGHWHQYIPLCSGRSGGILVNGCIKGYDEYARLSLRAPFAPASQALLFVHQDVGITAHWNVFVDEEPYGYIRDEEEKPWITIKGNLS